jgi:flavin-dependent thymidylate synthase
MNVLLAGYNIEATRIPHNDDATPEVLSAAYARISRSPKRIDQLREEAVREVDASRRSNTRIIFGMGHASVAEHAIFNIDIIGISRYLAEFVQKSRLASFTEKSQRYVKLHGDFVTPHEILGTPLESSYRTLIDRQNSLYHKLSEAGEKWFTQQGLDAKAAAERAREDARYVLSLATETQMGMTLNVRSLERLLRRLGKLHFHEAIQLRDRIQDLVEGIAPSLVRYTEPDPYDSNRVGVESTEPRLWDDDVRLLSGTENPDDLVLSMAMARDTGDNPDTALHYISQLSLEQKKAEYDKLFSGMEGYHPAPEPFEFADFTFALRMSSCAFAQFKRHRISSRIRTARHPNLQAVFPEWFQHVGMMQPIEEMMVTCTNLWNDLRSINPEIADYALTNAHAVQVAYRMNLRELYHFARLRCDGHAQWEIRALATRIVEIVKAKAPLSAALMMGKDEFDDREE